MKEKEGSGYIVIFLGLFTWFSLVSAIFYLLYQSLNIRITNEVNFTQALGHLAWPVVVFSLSLPIVFLISTNMKQLLSLKKTIDNAPENLNKALGKADEFQKSISATSAQLNNDLSEVLEQMESRTSTLDSRLRELASTHTNLSDNVAPELSLEERLEKHVNNASSLFYPALKRWNDDEKHLEDILVVTRGGGNRVDLTDKLTGESVFHENQNINKKISLYLTTAFKENLARRRKKTGISSEKIDELDSFYGMLVKDIDFP